jgi:hypothetical protein
MNSLAETGEFLHAARARNTVILTVTENLRLTEIASGGGAPSHDKPLFGWWRTDGDGNQVHGAFLHTPDFPLVLTFMCQQAVAALAHDLAATGRLVTGVNAETEAAEVFADEWRQHTGDAARVQHRMRFFRLARLVMPDPAPAGAPRLATDGDRDLLIEWFEAFVREIGDPVGQDHGAAVDERLEDRLALSFEPTIES